MSCHLSCDVGALGGGYCGLGWSCVSLPRLPVLDNRDIDQKTTRLLQNNINIMK